MLQALSVASLLSILLHVFREQIIGIFNDEDGVDVSTAKESIDVFIITNLVEMTLLFFMGIVRALGIQARVVIVSISCVNFISIPAACYMAFLSDCGIIGLWVGYFFGLFVQMVIVAYIVIMSDWQEIADNTEASMQKRNHYDMTKKTDRRFSGELEFDEEKSPMLAEFR